MKQYIVFDMDGVLFDSEQLISRCWKEMGAKMGLPHIYETFLDCVGTTQKNTQAVFQRTYPGVSYDEFQKGCRAGFFGHVDAHGMPLKSGARALLHHLREANWGIGLASSTRRVLVQSQLEGVGLWHYFDQVVTGDQLERRQRGRWRTPTTAFAPPPPLGCVPSWCPTCCPPLRRCASSATSSSPT